MGPGSRWYRMFKRLDQNKNHPSVLLTVLNPQRLAECVLVTILNPQRLAECSPPLPPLPTQGWSHLGHSH